ncbi:hypothetical protein ACTHPH_23475 [Paenibacillus pasadenensis]|uniref:hypothetical protein n=1 Tax=Paenibacillus TaxID=44249 RepID=UPI0003F67284|nr:hypothetical protein [Paenibacillus pasadenensis]
MNRGLKSILTMYRRDKFNWLLLPWLILLSSFTVNLVVAFSINRGGGEQSFTTGGLLSIIIYMFIVGMISVYWTFNFALSLCISRRDYFTGSGIAFLAMSVFHGALLTVATSIEQAIGGWFGMHFFVIPYTTDGPFWQTFAVYFTALLFAGYGGFVSGSLSRRYGKRGNFLLYGGAFILGGAFTTIASLRGWWVPIFDWISGLQISLQGVCLLLLALAVLFATLSWLMLRRSSARA